MATLFLIDGEIYSSHPTHAAAAVALRRARAFFSFIHGNSITITLPAINSSRASIKKNIHSLTPRGSKIKTQFFYRLWLVTSAGVNKRAARDREGREVLRTHTQSTPPFTIRRAEFFDQRLTWGSVSLLWPEIWWIIHWL